MKYAKRLCRIAIVLCLLCWGAACFAAAADPTFKQAQQRLQALGYDPGVADGKIGQKTIAAITRFQQAKKLPVTGKLDAATLRQLGVSTQQPAPSPETSTLPTFPKATSWVNDYAGMLSAAEKQELDALLREFETTTSNQVLVAIMSGLPPDFDLEEYVNELFERWQPGQKGTDNGVLLAVFINDRKLRIEVGYGLEADLTDAASKLIIENDIAPRFKEQQYFLGLKNGLTSILGTLQGTYAPRPPRRPLTVERLFKWLLSGICLGVSGLLLAAQLLRAALRRFAADSPGIASLIAWLETRIIPRHPVAKVFAALFTGFTLFILLLIMLPEKYKFLAVLLLLASPFLWSFYDNIKHGKPWYGERSSGRTLPKSHRSSHASSHSASSHSSSESRPSPSRRDDSDSDFSGGGGGRSGGGGASGSW